MYGSFTRQAHLDIGVGTGYFLRRLLETDWIPQRLIIADRSRNCLEYTSRRLRNIPHETLQLDVLSIDPASHQDLEGIESAAANFLLHCLPQGIASAQELVDFAARILGDGGVFFGSTITGQAAGQQVTSRTVMQLFNRLQIFGNRDDNADQLHELLSSRFVHCRIGAAGCVTLFAASNAELDELPAGVA